MAASAWTNSEGLSAAANLRGQGADAAIGRENRRDDRTDRDARTREHDLQRAGGDRPPPPRCRPSAQPAECAQPSRCCSRRPGPDAKIPARGCSHPHHQAAGIEEVGGAAEDPRQLIEIANAPEIGGQILPAAALNIFPAVGDVVSFDAAAACTATGKGAIECEGGADQPSPPRLRRGGSGSGAAPPEQEPQRPHRR